MKTWQTFLQMVTQPTHTVRKGKKLANHVAWLQQLTLICNHRFSCHPSRQPFISGGHVAPLKLHTGELSESCWEKYKLTEPGIEPGSAGTKPTRPLVVERIVTAYHAKIWKYDSVHLKFTDYLMSHRNSIKFNWYVIKRDYSKLNRHRVTWIRNI